MHEINGKYTYESSSSQLYNVKYTNENSSSLQLPRSGRLSNAQAAVRQKSEPEFPLFYLLLTNNFNFGLSLPINVNSEFRFC